MKMTIKHREKDLTEGVFYNIDAPSQFESIEHLDDGNYQGTIIDVIDYKKKELSVIQIEVEGVDEVFTTFLHWDLSKSFAWRDPIKEAHIKLPSDLKGMDIIFSISNNEVNGKIYSNLRAIDLFSPSLEGGEEDELLEDE